MKDRNTIHIYRLDKISKLILLVFIFLFSALSSISFASGATQSRYEEKEFSVAYAIYDKEFKMARTQYIEGIIPMSEFRKVMIDGHIDLVAGIVMTKYKHYLKTSGVKRANEYAKVV